jgi:hypothetical protein
MAKVTTMLARRESTEQSADPLRAQLTAAIGEAEVAKAALAQRLGAIEGAKALVSEARETLEAAEAAVEKARKQQASHLAARLSGSNRPAAENTVELARRKEEHAGDEVEIAIGALAELEEGFEEIREAALVAGAGVEAAINAIRAQVAAQLLEEARRHKIEFLAARQAVFVLARPENYNSASPAETSAREDARAALWALQKSEGWQWVENLSNARDKESSARIEAAYTKWTAAIEKLKTDPNAPLPT